MAKQRRRGKMALTYEFLLSQYYGFGNSSRAEQDFFGNQEFQAKTA